MTLFKIKNSESYIIFLQVDVQIFVVTLTSLSRVYNKPLQSVSSVFIFDWKDFLDTVVTKMSFRTMPIVWDVLYQSWKVNHSKILAKLP